MYCWVMQLTDYTRVPFSETQDTVDPTTVESGFHWGDHYLVQYKMDRVGASGGPLASGEAHHPLCSGLYDADANCWAIPKANVDSIYYESMV